MKDPIHYPSGENLLSDYPYWIFVQGKFHFGVDHDAVRGERNRNELRAVVARSQMVPFESVVILNPRSPITLAIPEGYRMVIRPPHTSHGRDGS